MGASAKPLLKGVSVWVFDEAKSASEVARNPENMLPHEIIEKLGKTSIDAGTPRFSTEIEFNNQPLGLKAHAVQVELPDPSARGGKRFYSIILLTDRHQTIEKDILELIAEDFKQVRNANHFVLSLPVTAPNVQAVFEQMKREEQACIIFFVNGELIDSHGIDEKTHKPIIAKNALVRLWPHIEEFFYDLERLFPGPRSNQKIEALRNEWRNRIINVLSSWEPLQYMVIPLRNEQAMILIRATPLYCLGIIVDRSQLLPAFQRISKYIRMLDGDPTPLEEQFKNFQETLPERPLLGDVLKLPTLSEPSRPPTQTMAESRSAIAGLMPDINHIKILLEQEKDLDMEVPLISKKSKIRRLSTVNAPPHLNFFVYTIMSGMSIEQILEYFRKHSPELNMEEALLKKILLKLEKTGNIKIERVPL
jgi:hypothetical protein